MKKVCTSVIYLTISHCILFRVHKKIIKKVIIFPEFYEDMGPKEHREHNIIIYTHFYLVLFCLSSFHKVSMKYPANLSFFYFRFCICLFLLWRCSMPQIILMFYKSLQYILNTGICYY